MQKTEKKETPTAPLPRQLMGRAQLIAGNSDKTDAQGPSPQIQPP